ncbi:MaoC family dehydratase [Rhizobium alvei]|uniref:MaoC family dehydratase n=1 Tax=Rhizobium alvei TaxID=1132659 RepID=A0ABT8YNR4_9HYPH|nr:MaoC family dehydratase [Rhizobium alvei]MDO6965337.1 MaoC family dehydratase [Rhizobium alvei]
MTFERPWPKGHLHLEDLSIGQRFESREQRMELDEVKEFAGRYDPQFFHLDEEEAAGSLFGRLAASGWHTAANSMRLMVESVPFARGLIGAGGEISWPKATFPGDTLRVLSEVVEIAPSRSRPDRGMVTLKCQTLNQHGEIVQVFNPRIVVWRRPATE